MEKIQEYAKDGIKWERVKILELYPNLVKIVRSWKKCYNKEVFLFLAEMPNIGKFQKRKN